MIIEKESIFRFKMTIDKNDYSFGIPAKSEEEAKQILIKSLKEIIVQLNAN